MLFPHLVLGTAQLGLPYGIANKTGQPDQDVATAIIREAWNGGIRKFDTAQAYGESEKVLGNAFDNLNIKHSAKVITKFSPNQNHNDENEMRNSILTSLNNLGIDKLHGILLHKEEYLNYWHEGLSDKLIGFRSEGLVEHLGVSVSNPKFAKKALEEKDISIIQVPSNILDRRFELTGIFKKAEDNFFDVPLCSFVLGILLLLDTATEDEVILEIGQRLIKMSPGIVKTIFDMLPKDIDRKDLKIQLEKILK